MGGQGELDFGVGATNVAGHSNSAIWLATSVSGPKVVLVVIDFGSDPWRVMDDMTWNLQEGDRPDAYANMHTRIFTFVKERQFDCIVVKGSEASTRRVPRKHFESAEHRGVVMAAAAAASGNLKVKHKSVVSRTFGERNTGEYVQDDSFWLGRLDTEIRKGSRETALIAIAAYEESE